MSLPKPYYERNGITLYHGDNREILPLLESASFDCAVVDPNYGETSCAWDRWFSEWLPMVRRSLKPSGSMWCFGSARMFLEHGPEFTAAGWRFVQDIVWEKQNGSSFHADRFKRVHEAVYQFRHDDVAWEQVFKAPVKTQDATARTTRRKGRPPHMGHIEAGSYVSHDGGPRLERSVIYAPNAHGHATNETQKVPAIVAPLLRYSCPPGGRALSPFAGSGTDLVVAQSLGLQAVGIEMREGQCEDAARRLSQMLPLPMMSMAGGLR